MKIKVLLLVSALSAVVSAAKLDGIAARVDSAVITVGDVMAEIRRNPDISGRMVAGNESEMQALYRAALDNLVERRLILKAAAEKGVEIPEWVIDNQLREIVNHSFGGDNARTDGSFTGTETEPLRFRIPSDSTVRTFATFGAFTHSHFRSNGRVPALPFGQPRDTRIPAYRKNSNFFKFRSSAFVHVIGLRDFLVIRSISF